MAQDLGQVLAGVEYLLSLTDFAHHLPGRMNAPIPTSQAVPGSHSSAAPGTTGTAGCGRNL